MKQEDISTYFLNTLKMDSNLSPAIGAMKALLETLRNDDSTTLQEFIEKMTLVREKLCETDVSVVSVSSGCELFVRFITMASKEIEQARDFKSVKTILLSRGEVFLKRNLDAQKRILEHSSNLITDDMVLLTHSTSRNVLAVLLQAAKAGRQFSVFVTESRLDNSGLRMKTELEKVGVKCTLILDSAVGAVMERINAVLVGAEGVCENGGIINKIGTLTMASLARLLNKPVYVVVESFKFLRFLPLNNASLPDSYLYKASVLNSGRSLDEEHPMVDYTPPDKLTLLYTDLGVLPTSAVTEHLIKLYT